MHLNVEIKAKCEDITMRNKIRTILREKSAQRAELDHQIDTYFKVNNGRLKLREGNIENYLVFYEREDKAGPKESNVRLLANQSESPLKEMLSSSLGILVTVDKTREIYFIDNIKFHIDQVNVLGWFVEIEAIDKNGSIGKEKLYEQCRLYMDLFRIREEDLVEKSYGDLILSARQPC